MIKLGQKVKSIITGLEGIATGKCIYLNGCVQFLVEPKRKKDGEKVKSEWIDEPFLKVVSNGILIEKTSKSKSPGGGMRNTPGDRYSG